jgi:hypothetical protein
MVLLLVRATVKRIIHRTVQSMDKRSRIGLAGGLVGFTLGVALTACVMSIFFASPAPVSSRRSEQAPAQQAPVKIYSHRIVVAAVKRNDIDEAVATMSLPHGEQQRVRDDVDEGKYRLVWVTLWDWDTTTEKGDTISISSDVYRRLFTLHNRRTTIAVPEPKSGYLELRGEQSEDGVIAISLLSGAQPLALPQMTLGQSIRVEIDTP